MAVENVERGEIIEDFEGGQELVVSPAAVSSVAVNPYALEVQREPDVVLSEAKRAADALSKVLDGKSKKVIFNHEQYLEFEDWQTVSRFYGVTCKEEGDPEYVELGGVAGFKASSVALKDGKIISRATAYCMRDEEKWSDRTKYAYCYVLRRPEAYTGNKLQVVDGGEDVWVSPDDPGPDFIVWEPNPDKPGKKRPRKIRTEVGQDKVPLYQLASMAQTRANSKVLRNVMSWVVVLAGYRPTPAEEMTTKPEPEQPKSDNPLRSITLEEWEQIKEASESLGWDGKKRKQLLKDCYGVNKGSEMTLKNYQDFFTYVEAEKAKASSAKRIRKTKETVIERAQKIEPAAAPNEPEPEYQDAEYADAPPMLTDEDYLSSPI